MSDDDPPADEGLASRDASGPGGDGPTFDAPWQARAFALAVALTDGDDRAWEAFQSRLVAEIEADETAGEGAMGRGSTGRRRAENHDAVYYHQWLAALERLLVEDGVLEPDELAERVAAFEAGDRSAHEFVEGDPHAHADRLPEGHAEGSDHGSHDHPH